MHMVELIHDTLVFSFPDVHPQARLRVTFQRTLRIPDNGKTYPLPPGLGAFPLKHVDDFAKEVPPAWASHGGVMFPMYQSEALWVLFGSDWIGENRTEYPFAVKIAAGKINAVTGQPWSNDLHARPQDYAVVPDQPWIDGFAVAKGVIRQFVAMPLGSGYSAEEQITGVGEHGGLQILVSPMKRAEFDWRFPRRAAVSRLDMMMPAAPVPTGSHGAAMGLAPGGRMKQEIYEDPYGLDAWDTSARGRCFAHLVNSLVWEAITGAKPPTPPLTAGQYAKHNLPWFDYYGEGRALDGGQELQRLRSVIEVAQQKGDVPLPENKDVTPASVVSLRRRTTNEVRDGAY
jgi:hypothetical protein